MAFDISNAFHRVWHAGLLHKRNLCEISGQIFHLISSFLCNRRLRVVLDGKSSQEYPVNAGVPESSILGPTLFVLYINHLLSMLPVILVSMLMIQLSVLSVIRHLICGNNLNWLMNSNLIYDTLWTGVRTGQLVSFDQSNNNVSIDVKMDESVLEEKSSF